MVHSSFGRRCREGCVRPGCRRRCGTWGRAAQWSLDGTPPGKADDSAIRPVGNPCKDRRICDRQAAVGSDVSGHREHAATKHLIPHPSSHSHRPWNAQPSVESKLVARRDLGRVVPNTNQNPWTRDSMSIGSRFASIAPLAVPIRSRRGSVVRLSPREPPAAANGPGVQRHRADLATRLRTPVAEFSKGVRLERAQRLPVTSAAALDASEHTETIAIGGGCAVGRPPISRRRRPPPRGWRAPPGR
jgi:hypothetical protein